MISKNVKLALSEPLIDSKNRVHNISFSLGVVTSNAEMESFKDLIDLADDLMYDSKNFKSQIIICNTKEEALYRQELKEEIYHAFDNKEIMPYFQPIYDKDNNVLWNEVLARWHHGENVLEASAFIPLLRRTGLIEELDIFIVKTTSDLFLKLKDNGEDVSNLVLSVNVNKKTLQNSGTNGYFDVLDSLKIPKKNLILELTEDIIVDITLQDKMASLSKLGYTLVVDDFSTSNTSIDSLRIDYIDYIKVDRSAMENLDTDYQISLLRELVYLMHTMHKKVIAEGVETKKQYDLAKALYFDGFQGQYLKSPSISLGDSKKK